MNGVTSQIVALTKEADELFERFAYECSKPAIVSKAQVYESMIASNLERQAQLRLQLDAVCETQRQIEDELSEMSTSKNLSIFGEKFIQPGDIPRQAHSKTVCSCTEVCYPSLPDTGRETPV